MNLVCWGLFAGFVAAPILVSVWIRLSRGLGFADILPVDFIYFYGDGRILNHFPFARLYDTGLQLKTFNEIFPFHDGSYGPSPYPPFVGLCFSLLARLSFWQAYLIWLVASLSLYLGGIALIAKACYPGERLKGSLIYCFSLAFYPFLVSTLANGQLASAAVFSVGAAIFEEKRGNLFLSGLALSILTYKPTLLLLILPMLLLTRRFRALLGYLAGASALILFATAFAGVRIWPVYLHFLRDFGRLAGLQGQSALVRWKYVDLNSLAYGMPGGQSPAGQWILLLCVAAVGTGLAVLLWKSARTGGRPAQDLAWAATLTWTLLLNVYVPIYDAALVTVAVILTLGAIRTLGWGAAQEWVAWMAGVLFAVSWVTVALAKSHGIQWITLVLAALGLGQLFLLYRAMIPGPKPTRAGAPAN